MRKHGSRSASTLAEHPVSPRTYAVVDYPQEKETISSPEYTFRVAVSPDADRVEVSIDGGEWKACRPAVGYWWYDWSAYPKGSYRVVARVSTPLGEACESEPRRFSVKFPKPAAAPKAEAPKPAAKAPARGRKKLSRSSALEA